jgi:hypothetical protein
MPLPQQYAYYRQIHNSYTAPVHREATGKVIDSCLEISILISYEAMTQGASIGRL